MRWLAGCIGLDAGRAGRRMTLCVSALSLISTSLASSVSSQEPATSRGTVLTPVLVGTADVPFSTARAIALLANGRTACVVDSYDHRVRCVDPDGSVVGVFGREGEGPGEFERPSDLTRGESGSVGVFDMGLGRFTIYEPGGTLVHTVRLPGSGDLEPNGAFGESVSGIETNREPDAYVAGAARSGFQTLYEFDVASGTVLRREELPPVPVEVDCGRIMFGRPNPRGGWVFLACEGHVVFVAEDGTATTTQAPTYSRELPTELDVAEYVAERQHFAAMGMPVSQERLDEYGKTPKRYQLAPDKHGFDAEGRWWIATFRDHREFSYLDVFCDGRYVGTVEVRDRLWGFDILESRLVVVVDRLAGSDDEPSAIPARGVDWYDIGGLSWLMPSACS